MRRALIALAGFALSVSASAQDWGGVATPISYGYVDFEGPYAGWATFTRAATDTDPTLNETLPVNAPYIVPGEGTRAVAINGWTGGATPTAVESLSTPIAPIGTSYSIVVEYYLVGTVAANTYQWSVQTNSSNFIALQDGGSGMTPQLVMTVGGSAQTPISLPASAFNTGAHELALTVTPTNLSVSVDKSATQIQAIAGDFTATSFRAGAPNGTNSATNILFGSVSWVNGTPYAAGGLQGASAAGFIRSALFTSPTQYVLMLGGQSLMQDMTTQANPLFVGTVWGKYLRGYMKFNQTRAFVTHFANFNNVTDGTSATSADYSVLIQQNAHGSSPLDDIDAPSQVNPATSSYSQSYSSVVVTNGSNSITIANLSTIQGGIWPGALWSCTGGEFASPTYVATVTGNTFTLTNNAGSGSAGDTCQAQYPNYWWNTVDNTATTGNALDTAGTPGFLLRQAEATAVSDQAVCAKPTVQCGFAWSQGTASMAQVASSPSAYAFYESQLKALFAAIRTSANQPNLPIFIHRHETDYNAQDQKYMNIIQIETDVAATVSGVYISTEEWPFRKGITNTYTLSSVSGSNVYLTGSTTNAGQNQLLTSTLNAATDIIPYNCHIGTVTANVSLTLLNAAGGACNATATNASFSAYLWDLVHQYPLGGTPKDTAGNTTFDGQSGFYAKAIRDARTEAMVLGYPEVTYDQGPVITSMVAPHIGNTTIDLNVSQFAGTTLVDGDGTAVGTNTAPDFYVLNNGTQVPVTASLVSPTDLRLTLTSGSLAAGPLTISYPQAASGQNYVVYRDMWLFDNAAPWDMPVQPTSPVINPAMSVTVN